MQKCKKIVKIVKKRILKGVNSVKFIILVEYILLTCRSQLYSDFPFDHCVNLL